MELTVEDQDTLLSLCEDYINQTNTQELEGFIIDQSLKEKVSNIYTRMSFSKGKSKLHKLVDFAVDELSQMDCVAYMSIDLDRKSGLTGITLFADDFLNPSVLVDDTTFFIDFIGEEDDIEIMVEDHYIREDEFEDYIRNEAKDTIRGRFE